MFTFKNELPTKLLFLTVYNFIDRTMNIKITIGIFLAMKKSN